MLRPSPHITLSLIASALIVMPAAGQAEENVGPVDMEVTMTVLTSDDALPEAVTHEIPLPAVAVERGEAASQQERARDLGQALADEVRTLRDDIGPGRDFGQSVADRARELGNSGNGGGHKGRPH